MKSHHEGLIAAPFTLRDKNGNLNLSIIPEYYRFLKQNGVDGAFIRGSTGEGVSLTMHEKKIVCKSWSEATHSD